MAKVTAKDLTIAQRVGLMRAYSGSSYRTSYPKTRAATRGALRRLGLITEYGGATDEGAAIALMIKNSLELIP